MRYAKTLHGLTIMAAVASAGPVAVAQKVTFEPSIELGQGYSDNVGLGGAPSLSDSVVTIRGILPVTRQWPKGQLNFRYEPSFSRNKIRDELDRDEHRLLFAVRGEPQRGAKYRLTTRFISSQLQGESNSTDDTDLFISRRTDRRIAVLDFTTEIRLSNRWSWEMGLGGSFYDYDAIDDFDDTSTNSSVEDRNEARGSVSFSRNLRGAGSKLGFELAHSEFDLDLSPDAATDSVRLVYNRRLGRHADARLALGAFGLDSRLESQDRTGVDINASLTRQYPKARLTLTARSAPSSGGALQGASTNSLLGLSIGNRGALWNWQISPRYAARDPSDPAAGTRRTLSLGGQIGRSITRQLRMQLRANQVEQSNPGDENRDVFTAEFAVQWFP